MRTRRPARRSQPSRAMVAMTAAVIAAALLLPLSPFAALLGFRAPAPTYLVLVLTIVVLYLLSAELAKRFFYRFHA